MSIIKQLATYDGSDWTTDDIGAKATNVSLTTNVAGQSNVQTALSKLCGTSALTASRMVVTNSNHQLTTSTPTPGRALVSAATTGIPTASSVTSTELGYLSGVTSNIQTQISGLNDYVLQLDDDLDTLNNNLTNINQLSQNLIPYPFYDTTKTINGITFTDNGDGTVTVNGTNTGSSTVEFVLIAAADGATLSKGSYITKTGITGGSSSTYMLQFLLQNPKTGTGVTTMNIGEQSKQFQTSELYKIRLSIKVTAGTSVNNLTFSPKLSYSNLVENSFFSYKEKSNISEINDNLGQINNNLGIIESNIGKIYPIGTVLILEQGVTPSDLSYTGTWTNLGGNSINNVAESVDLSSYNSESKRYTFPDRGFIRVSIAYNAGRYAQIALYNNNNNYVHTLGVSSTGDGMNGNQGALYEVFKNWSCYITKDSNASTVRFYQYTYSTYIWKRTA